MKPYWSQKNKKIKVMQFSIITINYNNKIGLENTISSVKSQSFTNFEHVIIDGNSTDGSKDVIESHIASFGYYISEPDTGVYNAMNKGIRASKGTYLLFLNSGDTLISRSVLEEVSEKINNNLDIYYGNLVYKSNQEDKTHTFPKELTFSFFYKKSLPHPATFIKKSLFDTVFYYNENFKIISDWEFFICAICKFNATYEYLNMVISNFQTDGLSNSIENLEQINNERTISVKANFPLFISDYNELSETKNTLASKRFKMLHSLEHSKIARKLNTIWLRFICKLVKTK